jgi:hypothetical protein
LGVGGFRGLFGLGCLRRLRSRVFVGAATSVGAVVGSGSLEVSVGWVELAVPVLVWALTTTPPSTVVVVVLGDVLGDGVAFSCSVVAGVIGGSAEGGSVGFVPVAGVGVELVAVDPLTGDVSDVGGFSGAGLLVSSAAATP